MILGTKLLVFLAAAVASGHHIVSNFYVDGVNQGPGVCLRIPSSTNPVTSVDSQDIVCNEGGARAEDITCLARAGSEITAQWRTWPDGSQDRPIDQSHQGPCSVYMKKIEQGQNNLAGNGWFKIWHDGVYGGKFCTDRIRENGNKMKFNIPRDLASGHYALRFEHIALHQAQNVGGAQFYVGCAQIFLRSTGGNRIPKETVSIPGYTSSTHPGILYNYWTKFASPDYKVPGPSPYIQTNSGGGAVINAPFSPHPKYPECLFQNANWCAVSLPAFNDERSCYEANEKCWSQLEVCYNTAPVSGYSGCVAYEAHCSRNSEYCKRCAANRNCRGSFPKGNGAKARRSISRRHGRHFN